MVCDIASPRRIKGNEKIYIHKPRSSADMRGDINRFFTSRGTSLGRVSGNPRNTPSRGVWYLNTNRSKTLGYVMYVNYKGKGYMGWTYTAKRIFVEVEADASAQSISKWWSRRTY